MSNKVGEIKPSFTVPPQLAEGLPLSKLGRHIAVAKVDEHYDLSNGYKFNGKTALVVKSKNGRWLVKFANGRLQWLDAHQVRVKSLLVNGEWLKRKRLRAYVEERMA